MKSRIRFSGICSFLSIVLIISASLLYLSGCSESDSPSGPSDSDGVSVSLSTHSLRLGITETYQFSATVSGGQAENVIWYVDSIMGGSSELGTITQSNPAVYTAPDAVPTPDAVQVMAVSADDTTSCDSCAVTVTFNTVYVNSSAGNDDTGVGGKNKPFKSITKGLSVSEPEMKVLAAPGIYDYSAGEVFPITVPDSVVLEGEDWESCVIRMDAETVERVNAVLINCRDCGFRKFTLEEPDAGEPVWNIAVYFSGATSARADSIRCLERANYAVLRVSWDDGSIVENCHFVVSDGNYFDRGMEIVFNHDGNGTILRGNRISGFISGIFFNSFQNTLVENCNLSGNSIGANLCCNEDEYHQPNPDFGGGARGSTGGNDFSNTGNGIYNATANVIYAMYNIWENSPPVEGQDFYNSDSLNGGAVITE